MSAPAYATSRDQIYDAGRDVGQAQGIYLKNDPALGVAPELPFNGGPLQYRLTGTVAVNMTPTAVAPAGESLSQAIAQEANQLALDLGAAGGSASGLVTAIETLGKYVAPLGVAAMVYDFAATADAAETDVRQGNNQAASTLMAQWAARTSLTLAGAELGGIAGGELGGLIGGLGGPPGILIGGAIGGLIGGIAGAIGFNLGVQAATQGLSQWLAGAAQTMDTAANQTGNYAVQSGNTYNSIVASQNLSGITGNMLAAANGDTSGSQTPTLATIYVPAQSDISTFSIANGSPYYLSYTNASFVNLSTLQVTTLGHTGSEGGPLFIVSASGQVTAAYPATNTQGAANVSRIAYQVQAGSTLSIQGGILPQSVNYGLGQSSSVSTSGVSGTGNICLSWSANSASVTDQSGSGIINFSSSATSSWQAGAGTDTATLSAGGTNVYLAGARSHYTLVNNSPTELVLANTNNVDGTGTKTFELAGGYANLIFGDGVHLHIGATPPHTHAYTSQFGTAQDPNASTDGTLSDSAAGVGIDASAVTAASLIDLKPGSTDSQINGHALTISGGSSPTIVSTAYGSTGGTKFIASGTGVDYEGEGATISNTISFATLTTPVEVYLQTHSDSLGDTIDGIANLVQAMATFQASHSSFNPQASGTTMPSDTTLQNALAANWHH